MHPRRCTRYALHVRSDPGSVRRWQNLDAMIMALWPLMALMAAPWILGHSTDVQLKASNCPASALRGSASSIIVAADVAEPGASTSTHWPQVHRVHRVIVGTMIVMFMVESPRPRPWDDGYGVVLSKHCWIHPIRAPSERKATPQRA